MLKECDLTVARLINYFLGVGSCNGYIAPHNMPRAKKHVVAKAMTRPETILASLEGHLIKDLSVLVRDYEDSSREIKVRAVNSQLKLLHAFAHYRNFLWSAWRCTPMPHPRVRFFEFINLGADQIIRGNIHSLNAWRKAYGDGPLMARYAIDM